MIKRAAINPDLEIPVREIIKELLEMAARWEDYRPTTIDKYRGGAEALRTVLKQLVSKMDAANRHAVIADIITEVVSENIDKTIKQLTGS